MFNLSPFDHLRSAERDIKKDYNKIMGEKRTCDNCGHQHEPRWRNCTACNQSYILNKLYYPDWISKKKYPKWW